MPPKTKFTKEEIIVHALSIVETEGADRLTARRLGEALGSSPRPIFTAFRNMDEVFSETITAAKELYTRYVLEGLRQPLPFKGVGEQYIRFAGEHKNLFRLLFMTPVTSVHSRSILQSLDNNYENILSSITDTYALSVESAEKLYLHLWIYSHGIAVSIATDVCRFPSEQISEMLTQVFVGLLSQEKKGGNS